MKMNKINKGGGKIFSEVMDKFLILIVIIVSWVHTYLQTYKVVYIQHL